MSIEEITATKQAHRVIKDRKEVLALLKEDKHIEGSEEVWNVLLTNCTHSGEVHIALLSFL